MLASTGLKKISFTTEVYAQAWRLIFVATFIGIAHADEEFEFT
jgi:hypothetical protein